MLEAARRVGLDPDGARLASSSSRIIWHLPASGAALAISRPGTKSHRDVASEASAIRAATSAGVRTPRLLADPIRLDGSRYALTYDWIDGRHLRPEDWPAVGREAARLAHAPSDGLPVLRWPAEMPDPEWASVLGADLYSVLVNRCGLASASLDALATTGNLVLCHGDLQPANVLVDRSGIPWLIDLEYACLAPREWDPTKLIILAHRFGDPADIDEVLTAWPDLDPARIELCTSAQETLIVAWLARMAVQGTSRATAEARRRARTLCGDRLPWCHL